MKADEARKLSQQKSQTQEITNWREQVLGAIENAARAGRFFVESPPFPTLINNYNYGCHFYEQHPWWYIQKHWLESLGYQVEHGFIFQKHAFAISWNKP